MSTFTVWCSNWYIFTVVPLSIQIYTEISWATRKKLISLAYEAKLVSIPQVTDASERSKKIWLSHSKL